MTPYLRILLPVTFAALATPAVAQSVRCVDKDGRTVYMERPCATYGYRTEKQIKDPPKGDGTGRPLQSGQALIGSPSQQPGGSARRAVQMFCHDRQSLCTPGDTVICGGERRLCDSD